MTDLTATHHYEDHAKKQSQRRETIYRLEHESNEHLLKASIHRDSYYDFQCSAQLYRWDGSEWQLFSTSSRQDIQGRELFETENDLLEGFLRSIGAWTSKMKTWHLTEAALADAGFLPE